MANTVFNPFTGTLDYVGSASGGGGGATGGITGVTDTATIDLTKSGSTLSADLVAGSVTNTYVATGIDAAKLADGSVSNAEFQRLNGVTSDIQTQLNAKLEDVASTGSGVSLYSNEVANTAYIKSLAAGAGISLSDSAGTVTVAATAVDFITGVADTARIDLTVSANSLSADLVTGSVSDTYLASGIDAAKIANGSVSNAEFQQLDGASANIQAQIDARILLTEKGVASGVATLDNAGKIPSSQLPSTVMEYLGVWNAATNTPTLASGVGDNGDVYRVSVSGTQDIGEGPTTFFVGDYAIYNGTIWQRSPGTDGVISVNGFQGVVTLDTDDVAEGSSNLYYTDARALAAVSGALSDTATIDLSYAPSSISASLVTGSVTDAYVATGIDAAKIANGSVSNTEYQYLDGVTGAIQTQINDLQPQAASANQMVWVLASGNDSTGNGTYNKPYLTIAQALSSITDASNTKRYTVMVGPKNLAEPVFNLKPYVWICGTQRGATRIQVTGGNIGLDSSWATTTGRTGLQNILISGSNNQLNLDLQAIGGAGSCVVELNTAHVNGLVTWKARSSADVAEIWQSQFLGNLAFSGGNTLLFNSYVGGAAVFDVSGVSDTSNYDITRNYFSSNVTFSSSTTTINSRFLGNANLGSVTLSGSGVVAVVDVLAGDLITSGSPSVTLNSDSQVLAYAPAATGDWSWAPAVPNDVKEALDYLAPAATGKIDALASTGGGIAIYDSESASTAYIRSVTGAGNVSISQSAGLITISGFSSADFITSVSDTSTVDLTVSSGALSADLVTGSITDLYLASGINALKLGNGDVDNTELSYLDGASANIQTQLNDLVAATALSVTGVSDTARIDLTLSGQDVSADIVTGSVGDTYIASGIDAAKLADGSVSNTEYQTLNGVTGSIQTQLNTKLEDVASTGGGLSLYDSESANVAYIRSVTGAGIVSVSESAGLITISATSSPDFITGVVDTARIDLTVSSGDLSADLVTGSVTDAYVATGIDAAKIANGSVSNTEYQYLDGVTGSLQTQLNTKIQDIVSTGGGISLINDDTGTQVDLRSLASSGIITITELNGLLTIGAAATADFVTGISDTSTIDLSVSSGNLSASVVDASITNVQLASGLSVTSFADGSVDNAEFQRLNGVTGSIQTQLNTKLEDVASTGSGVSLFSNEANNVAYLKSLVEGSGISLSSAGDSVTIAATSVDFITGVTDTARIDLTVSANSLSADLVTGSVSDAYIATGIDAAKIADGSISNTEYQYLNGATANLQSQIDARILLTEKGAASGVATLDGAGKIPVSQLPSSVMEYKGAWNASTNSPTLASGVGDVGDTYRTSVSGTQDLGDGSTTFFVGDFVIYNGSIWQRSPAADGVVSVNGFQGVVSLDSDDIPEGSTNLYFTDARALAAVTGALTDTATIDFSYAPTSITADVKAASITNVQLASGLSVTSFGNGSVDNTEFQYLNGVTSSIQTQLDSKLVDVASTGTGVAIYDSEAANVAYVRSLAEGTGISITQSAGTITIASTAGGAITGVSDTNSIDLTISSGALSADLRLSASGPSGSNVAVPLDILSDGLRAQLAPSSLYTNLDSRYMTISGYSVSGDIVSASATIADNQSGTNVAGLAFANSSVRSAVVDYSIFIDATLNRYEEGELRLVQLGSDWSIARQSTGEDSLVTFDVDASGQVTYSTPSYIGFVSGKMSYRAKVTLV